MYDVLDVSRYVINYSHEQGYLITPLRLSRLLYFIQGEFLAETGAKCFDDYILATDNGIIVPSAQKEFGNKGRSTIPPVDIYIVTINNKKWKFKRVKFDDTIIQDEDKRIIREVVDEWSDKTISDMAREIYNEEAWIRTYKKGEVIAIPTLLLKNCFRRMRGIDIWEGTKKDKDKDNDREYKEPD